MQSCVHLTLMQQLMCRCQRNLCPRCLSACIAHSAAAACKACERTRGGGRQHGATESCRRPCCRRRAGRRSIGRCSRCSRCRFESSSSQLRSDADISALLPLTTIATVLMQCSSLLCMLLCRGGAGVEWGLSTPSVQRRAALRAVRPSPQPLQGNAVHLSTWQVLSGLLQRSAPDCCPCDSTAALQADIRHPAVDAAVEATEAASLRHRRSFTADRLPCGSIASAAAHHSRRADTPAHIRARADPQHSFAAHPLRADDDYM